MLLFFHRLNYDYKMKDGTTLLQHIYNTHFDGASEVEEYVETWDALKDLLPEEAYTSVAARLQRQLANANEWCDQINTYFYRKTGILDKLGRHIHP